MSNSIEFPHRSRAAVIIKAAPTVGQKHGETVCVAAIDYEGNWHRLYPVPFRDLEESQKFKRWQVVEFDWRRPDDDDRAESKRINPQTLRIVGEVPVRERHPFARRAIVDDLDAQKLSGKSFALIRPRNPVFTIRPKKLEDFNKEAVKRLVLHQQHDMFSDSIIPREPAPFEFKYRFEFGGKVREHKCIDWETEATFFKWRKSYGEDEALKHMQKRFGDELPEQGVAFAMGTNRVKAWDNWLLSAIIRVNEDNQPTLL